VETKDIQDLIELISRSDFSTFELEREGFRIKLVRGEARSGAPVVHAPAVSSAGPLPAPPAAAEAPPAAAPAVEDGLYELHSPIVGTFYRAPSPDTPTFAEIGNHVCKVQVLCIVEAMKVMNEIESEVDAEVVEILVKNGQPVEFGEVLFRLRPS
jgi:acetyl-CoA carboxylase biotin carboxyl carrier protein